jgi:hypothetical protein
MQLMRRRTGVAAAMALLLLAAGALLPLAWTHQHDSGDTLDAEFYFIRLEYVNLAGARGWSGRPWWRQDWPAAENHFLQGIRRLTGIDAGEGRHVPLTDDRIFDYPWAYATQVGYWDLSVAETDRLREYLLRGGFLVVDDFYGPQDWEVFRASMERVFPGEPIVDIDEGDPLLHVLYDLDQRTQIPGLRHLRMSPGGQIVVESPYSPPQWRGIYDQQGRLVVAINFNMDVGDAWEHADMPEYPEPMTALAYRFGINYIVYAMTH